MSLAAALALGAAFAFKAQAVIILPYLLYLVIAKQFPIRHLFLVPFVYIVMMIPAALAGRPWLELLSIYVHQAQTYHHLALNAPNLYTLLQDFGLLSYEKGLVIGSVIAAFIGLGVTLGGLKFRARGTNLLIAPTETNLLIATTSAVLLPFVLPKMHDRYFFVADVFTFLLAFAVPTGWRVAVLVQLGSIFAYTKFLLGFSLGPTIGAALMTGAVVCLFQTIVEYWNRTSPRPEVSRRSWHPPPAAN